MLAGTAARLDHRCGDRGRTPLGEHHSLHARRLGAAQDRPQVLGVLDAVQADQQGGRAGQQSAQVRELARRQFGRDALVVAPGQRLDPLPADDLDSGQSRQLLEPRVGVQPLGDQRPLDAARASRLENRVAAVDKVQPRPPGTAGRVSQARWSRARVTQAVGPGRRAAGPRGGARGGRAGVGRKGGPARLSRSRPPPSGASGRPPGSPRGRCPGRGAPP